MMRKPLIPLVLTMAATLACQQIPALAGPTPAGTVVTNVPAASDVGEARAEAEAPDWLTLVDLQPTSAKVHVAPPSACPPIPPPTYGAIEVWIAPYQGINKTDVGRGDWTLEPLQPETHYRVFAWYTDTCGKQHTSNEIAFDTPPLR